MKLKRIMASILAICMVLSTMGTVVFAEETEIATVDGVGYASFADAIKAAQNNGTITLLADINLGTSETILVGGRNVSHVTIDGDGHTLTFDEVKPYYDMYYAAFYPSGTSAYTVKNLTVELNNAAPGFAAFDMRRGGTLENVTVNGKFEKCVTTTASNPVIVTGCTFNGADWGVYADGGYSNVTVTGSTFNTTGAALLNGDTVFTGNIIAADSYVESTAAIDVSGNYWDGGAPTADQLKGESIICDTYYASNNDGELGDLTQNGVAEEPVIKVEVGNETYEYGPSKLPFLNDLVGSDTIDDTKITLLSDVVLENGIQIAAHIAVVDGEIVITPKNVEIDLNSYALTGFIQINGNVTATIKNGTVNNDSSFAAIDVAGTAILEDLVVESVSKAFKVDNDAKLIVKQGIYSSDPADYLANGFDCADKGDGTYVVEKGTITKLFGSGIEEDPYLISSVEELEFFRNSVNAGETTYNTPGAWVALGADIDLKGAAWERGIGDGINATFDGNFDGNGFAIKNLVVKPYADADAYICGGLFGYIYGGVTIKDLVLENVTVATADAGYNVGALVGFANNNGGKANISDITVTGDVVIDAPNAYGVGAVVGYSYRDMGIIDNCAVDADAGSYINGYSFVGGITGYSYSNAVISNCSVNNIDITGTSFSVGGIAGLVISGNKITDCEVDSSVDVSGQANVGSVVGALAAETVIIENCKAAYPMVGGNYEDNMSFVAGIGNKYYTSLAEAIEAAEDGQTVNLFADVTIDTSIINTKKITLNLNDKTITGLDNTNKSFGLINNRGELTITGTGKITLKSTINSGWDRYSSVVSNNPGGKLVVESGIIEHLGGTDMAYAIDNLTNGKGTYAETVINGGTIKSPYRAVRQFLNGIEAQNILTVNGGTIEGANKAIWFQDPSKNANSGTLTVGEGATVNGDVYLTVTAGSTEWPVEVNIAASAVNGEVLATNIPLGYKFASNNGTYGVTKAEAYGTWGGIDWTLVNGTLTIAPTAGTPVADTNSGKTYEVGEWREAVKYNSKGEGVAIEGWPYDRTKVTKLVIEEGVTSIGSFTAQDFTNLTGEVVIPSTVTYIGQEAFQRSTFTKLTFAEGGTEELCIAQGAFKNLIIEEVSLPADRPVHIHAWVFNNCHNLKNATLPATLVSVHGTNHIDYFKDFNAHSNPTWTKSSEIFAYNENMETITFGSEAVRDMFYANNNGTSKDYTAANVGLTTYCSFEDAWNAAQDGDTIKLLKNVSIYKTLTNNKNITLDLNGKTITGKDTTEKNFSLIDNRGELTITGNGTMILTASVNSGWARYSAVLANNPGGKLIVENGTIEHLGGTDMAYGIDNLTNGKGTYAETIINGGTIKSTYRAVRQFLNGVEADNILAINGGVVEGTNKSIFFHDPSKNANSGTLTVADGATLVGDVYLFVTEGSTEWPVEVSIAESAVGGYNVSSANLPLGYEVVKNDGYYGIKNSTSSGYTVTAIADKTEVRYNNGNPNTFTVKYVVTGGNVFGVAAQLTYDKDLFECDEDTDDDGIIRMNKLNLTADANGDTVIEELHFTVKRNVATDTTYTFAPQYVQVVSDYDAAGSGTQNGFVENVIGDDVTVIAQYDVTLLENGSIEGNTYVDQEADYTANIKDFDEDKTYTVTYTMEGTDEPQSIEVTKDTNGEFVIENVTGDIVFTGVTSKLNFELVILPDIVAGHVLVMVKDGVSAGYKYDGAEMYEVERYEELTEVSRTDFIGDITGATSVRAILIRVVNDDGSVDGAWSDAYNNGAEAVEDYLRTFIEVSDVASKSIEETFDVNKDGGFWYNDAVTAHGCYKIQYELATKMAWYLSSDVNTDFIIDTDDYNDTVEVFWSNIPTV